MTGYQFNVFCFSTKISRLILSILTICFFFSIISLGARLVTFYYLSTDIQSYHRDDLFSVLMMGARFDAKIGVVGALIALASLFFKWKAFISNWTRLIWFVALSILVSNYYYLSFYQTPFNALMFGLADDDNTAILETTWHDFPILRIALCLVILSLLIAYLQNKITNGILNRITGLNKRPLLFIPSMLIVFTLIVFLMKGTLHGVALQR